MTNKKNICKSLYRYRTNLFNMYKHLEIEIKSKEVVYIKGYSYQKKFAQIYNDKRNQIIIMSHHYLLIRIAEKHFSQ